MDDAQGPTTPLTAGDGLSATIDGGRVRISYAGHDDWFGPGTLRVGDREVPLDAGRTVGGVDELGEWTATMWLAGRGSVPRIDASLAAYPELPVMVFSLRAPVGIDGGLATGTFESPSVSWPAFVPVRRDVGGVPEDACGFGYQYMEFALPTSTDADLAGWTRWPLRPAAMQPLLLVAEGAAVLLGPLDAFHEQVIAVPEDAQHAADGVRCGWHGDLESVPRGFGTELGVVAGRDARDCLDRWASMLTGRAGTTRPARGIDTLGSHVSYWTDNGAAYWYRTEPSAESTGTADGAGRRSVTDTLADTLADLRDRDVPYGAVQLDSWFYPHRTLRPFDTEAWDVPPTGLREWQARDDILPDGVTALRDALGGPPLVAHCRHLSSDSPYVEDHDCWVDGEYAHPTGPELYETYLDQCLAWGVETFEHDWLIECFLGVRGLRAEPGRAAAWQKGLDRALAARGMTAQWCMASPADMMATTELGQVTSIRTSGDHGYLVPPELLWAWFLYTNAFVRPLGLWPYKDVFRSDGHGGSTDPGAEAALSALSGGPVGIGDALGGADRDLVLGTARRDGLIVAPDAPVAAIARSFRRHGVLHPEPVVGATHTQHAAGRWSYVITMNCHDGSDHQSCAVALAELGDDAPRDPDGTPSTTAAVLDQRRGSVEVVDDAGFAVELGAKGWDLRVVAPLLCDGRLAVFGDADRSVSAGRQRLGAVHQLDDAVRVRLAGSDESVRLVGWSDGDPSATVVAGGPGREPADVEVRRRDDGGWELTVDVPAEPGWAAVELRP